MPITNAFAPIYNTFNAGSSPVYWLLYFIMVVAFTFFYALVIFQHQLVSSKLIPQELIVGQITIEG